MAQKENLSFTQLPVNHSDHQREPKKFPKFKPNLVQIQPNKTTPLAQITKPTKYYPTKQKLKPIDPNDISTFLEGENLRERERGTYV